MSQNQMLGLTDRGYLHGNTGCIEINETLKICLNQRSILSGNKCFAVLAARIKLFIVGMSGLIQGSVQGLYW